MKDIASPEDAFEGIVKGADAAISRQGNETKQRGDKPGGDGDGPSGRGRNAIHECLSAGMFGGTVRVGDNNYFRSLLD